MARVVGFGVMLGAESLRQSQFGLMAEQSLDKTQMLLQVTGISRVRVQVAGFSMLAAGFDSGALGAAGPLAVLCLEDIRTAKVARPTKANNPKAAIIIFDLSSLAFLGGAEFGVNGVRVGLGGSFKSLGPELAAIMATLSLKVSGELGVIILTMVKVY